MSFLMLFGIIAVSAYGIQILLGYQQIKEFNKVYLEVRNKGRVVIGRNPGRLKAGTLILFGIDDKDIIFAAYKMQGVTVFSKFKALEQFIGQDIHFIDQKHPLVQKENRLTQIAMEDARNLFINYQLGIHVEEEKPSPLRKLGQVTSHLFDDLKSKVKGSVQ
ncbi:transcriptional regulator GutM [Aerococcus kribbianus]|uniref:Transcriptional regulator GutM n=1 Tax=Aerococcus kribbianus TaxID=2999064 RepID=A0A9X3JFG4_9LACT|nr:MULTISPECIES: transcriptional regulator GutM [unclassified Aerococcus]MCZ0717603.1 transcriptional regulator GutM [Aerococcus sp. YH-aer221]MCZ0725891.1 transcriptional regulator GutM [Aerococcus sp. YH-aer222]